MRRLVLLFVFVAFFSVSCKEELKRRPLKRGQVTHAESKKELSTVSRDFGRRGIKKTTRERVIAYYDEIDIFRPFAVSAQQSLIVVESDPPDWLEDFLIRLSEKRPLLKVVCFFGRETERGFCQSVPSLRASFAISDQSCMIVGPLYTASDRGVSYQTCRTDLVSQYVDFVRSLFGEKQ